MVVRPRLHGTIIRAETEDHPRLVGLHDVNARRQPYGHRARISHFAPGREKEATNLRGSPPLPELPANRRLRLCVRSENESLPHRLHPPSCVRRFRASLPDQRLHPAPPPGRPPRLLALTFFLKLVPVPIHSLSSAHGRAPGHAAREASLIRTYPDPGLFDKRPGRCFYFRILIQVKGKSIKRTDGRITLLSLYGIPTVPPIRCLRIRTGTGE